MPEPAAEPKLRADDVRFSRHRQCPVRRGYVELIAWVGPTQFSWCLPGPAEDEPGDSLSRIELLAHRYGVQLIGCRDDGQRELIGLGRALAWLESDRAPQLVIDETLIALHA